MLNVAGPARTARAGSCCDRKRRTSFSRKDEDESRGPRSRLNLLLLCTVLYSTLYFPLLRLRITANVVLVFVWFLHLVTLEKGELHFRSLEQVPLLIEDLLNPVDVYLHQAVQERPDRSQPAQPVGGTSARLHLAPFQQLQHLSLTL